MDNKKEIYKLVITEEIKAQNLYRILSKALHKEESHNIFDNLIKVERLHEETLRELFEREFPSQKLNVAPKPQTVNEDITKLTTPQMALKFAINREEKAEKLYLELASRAKDSATKELFLKFAKDEQNHKLYIEDELNSLSGLMTWFDESELNGLMED